MTIRTVRADEVRVGDALPLDGGRTTVVDTIEHAHTAQGRRIRLWLGIGRDRDHIDVTPAAPVRIVERSPRSNHQAPPAVDLPIDALTADLDTWWTRLPRAHQRGAFEAAFDLEPRVSTLVGSLDDLGPWWHSLRPAERLRVYRAARPTPAPVAERLAAEAAGWSRLIDALDLIDPTPETTP